MTERHQWDIRVLSTNDERTATSFKSFHKQDTILSLYFIITQDQGAVHTFVIYIFRPVGNNLKSEVPINIIYRMYQNKVNRLLFFIHTVLLKQTVHLIYFCIFWKFDRVLLIADENVIFIAEINALNCSQPAKLKSINSFHHVLAIKFKGRSSWSISSDCALTYDFCEIWGNFVKI